MNSIISIGYLGVKKCYLNIDKEDAISRYCKSENITRKDFDKDEPFVISDIRFNTEFAVYDIWEDEDN